VCLAIGIVQTTPIARQNLAATRTQKNKALAILVLSLKDEIIPYIIDAIDLKACLQTL
jgi:hypothetical protein